jgi:hypothetical protein
MTRHQAQPVAGRDQFVALGIPADGGQSAGLMPKRRSVIAMFIATPPGSRVMRPGTSDPSRIAVGERPMMSHRTEPMQRMSGVMPPLSPKQGAIARGHPRRKAAPIRHLSRGM